MRYKAPGVISVFAALIWCLIASLVFVLLDGVRVTAMSNLLEDRVHLAGRNVMANYQKELYETYGILGIDELYSRFGEEDGEVVQTMMSRELEYEKELEKTDRADRSFLSARINLLNYPAINVSEGSYQLLSDGGGKVFLKQTASYMTALLPEKTAEKLLGEYEEQEAFQEENEVGQIYEAALEALQTASQILAQSQEDSTGEAASALENNEMTSMEKRRKEPVLDLVLPGRTISSAYIEIEHCPSKRKLQQGTLATGSITMQEKILGICYYTRMFSDYLTAEQTNGKVTGAGKTTGELSYQTEYLIAGKNSDRENLSSVCSRLLVIRETVQFARYYANPKQKAKAYAESLALVGFTGNPVLIKAVQLGFLAAWSFEEAVSDVQKLLQGEEVRLLGDGSSPKYDYQDYLKFLLFLKPAEQTAMRGLDVIENHLNAGAEGGTFYVDRTITAMEGQAEARLPWLFANLITVPLNSQSYCSKTVSWSEDYD